MFHAVSRCFKVFYCWFTLFNAVSKYFTVLFHDISCCFKVSLLLRTISRCFSALFHGASLLCFMVFQGVLLPCFILFHDRETGPVGTDLYAVKELSFVYLRTAFELHLRIL